jgi:uncharacterized protein (DUF488 family)
MKIFTIGFTQKSAEKFFGLLGQPGLVRLVDIRLNNVSQLAGFSKRDDLQFFARKISRLAYAHVPELAPSLEILEDFKTGGRNWSAYESQFLALMASRKVELTVERELLAGACLLCSEPSPQKCHRRLVAEYLQSHWDNLEIQHLE